MSFSVSRSAALLLCCSAAGSRKALQLYLWRSRYRKTRAVSSYLCDSHGRCFCVYVCVRVSVRVSVVCAVIGAQNDQEQRRINFVKSSRSAVRPLHQYECTSAVQQQRYDGSRVPQAVAFVPVVKVYMCVWLVSSRRSNHHNIFTSNATIKTHAAGPHTRYTKHTAAASSSSYKRWDTPVFLLFDLRHPPGSKGGHIPKGNLIVMSILIV